jgi:IclR family mhp operon transcriptional activator
VAPNQRDLVRNQRYLPSSLAFCPISERSMLLDMLARSQESEDKLATGRKRALSLLAAIRKQGFA